MIIIRLFIFCIIVMVGETGELSERMSLAGLPCAVVSRSPGDGEQMELRVYFLPDGLEPHSSFIVVGGGGVPNGFLSDDVTVKSINVAETGENGYMVGCLTTERARALLEALGTVQEGD